MKTNGYKRVLYAFWVAVVSLCYAPGTAPAQVPISGQIVGVLDGRTVEIRAGSSHPVRVQLFGVEVPNDDLPIGETVIEHLGKLAMDCQVDAQVYGDLGSVTCKGTDLSLQLVRDGAAWVWPDGFNGATRHLMEEFRFHESLAKAENRGVWEDKNLFPPSTLTAAVQKSRDPITDVGVTSMARSVLGPAVEGVFGPEIYSVERSDCSGKVVGVVDGDTLKILNGRNQLITVRLAGIDAPEKSQPFGNAAKQRLSDLAFGQHVTCESTKRDRYGRVVGKLTINGRDINLEMVKGCMAWHYKDYQKEQSLADRNAYAAAENTARTSKCGLWDGNPVSPSEFRKQRFLAYYAPDSDGSYYSGGYSSSTPSPRSGGGSINVRSYTRRDGTVVRGHTRSAPRRP